LVCNIEVDNVFKFYSDTVLRIFHMTCIILYEEWTTSRASQE